MEDGDFVVPLKAAVAVGVVDGAGAEHPVVGQFGSAQCAHAGSAEHGDAVCQQHQISLCRTGAVWCPRGPLGEGRPVIIPLLGRRPGPWAGLGGDWADALGSCPACYAVRPRKSATMRAWRWAASCARRLVRVVAPRAESAPPSWSMACSATSTAASMSPSARWASADGRGRSRCRGPRCWCRRGRRAVGRRRSAEGPVGVRRAPRKPRPQPGQTARADQREAPTPPGRPAPTAPASVGGPGRPGCGR